MQEPMQEPMQEEDYTLFDQMRHEQNIDIIFGIISGDGHILGRMASSAPGAIDPTEIWQTAAQELEKQGLTTREAIAAEYYKRMAAAEAAPDEDDG